MQEIGKTQCINAIIPVFKPKGPTSNAVLNDIRKIVGSKKVGHAGTLDPLAEGVLVVGIGKEATKKLQSEVKKEKEYIAKIKLGEFSETDDEEGGKIAVSFLRKPDSKDIKRVIKEFIGEINQVPPQFSAVKVKGREAYKSARKGIAVELKPRKVLIKKIKIIKYKWPYLLLDVVTGPGVYIRSLARDLGKKLKVGGYVADLKRIRVGEFTEKKCLKIG